MYNYSKYKEVIQMKKIGIFGATGYAGQQLTLLLKQHPSVKIRFMTSNQFSNRRFSDIYPKFKTSVDDLLISTKESLKQLNDVDLVFLALPHGISMNVVKEITKMNKEIKIIDLSGDFRLKKESNYEKYYKKNHSLPSMLKSFVYGLPEINKKKIQKSQYIANPGCYPTSAILPLFPLIEHKIIKDTGIIIDSKSGISGTGRKENINFLLTEASNNAYAYNTGEHRHEPEISGQLMDVNLTFSPHVIPSIRGIFTTIYCTLADNINQSDVLNIYKTYYQDKNFIRLKKEIPQTKDVSNTNYCDISFKILEDKNQIILFSCIDNLMKGAASQSIQNMNLIFGFNETLGINQNLYYL